MIFQVYFFSGIWQQSSIHFIIYPITGILLVYLENVLPYGIFLPNL